MNNSNDKKSRGGKGYYIALFLCLCAVGAAGYALIATVTQKPTQQTVSVPLKPEKSVKTAPVSATVEAEALPKTGDEKVREIADQLTVEPVKGAILQGFSLDSLSYNDTTRDWRLHPAVDIAAQGQTVMAARAGTVQKVYDDDYLGTTVVLTHGGGYETRYSNLTAMPTVKTGDTVKAGDIIGAVGDTAIVEAAMEPHLHFQVLKDDVPMDPADFLG